MKKSTEGASRFHYLIPIEIQDRELEAKLLISLYILLKNKNARVILGQSGSMNVVSAMFNYPSILLDKSCSRAMYEGRIKFVISHGGRVVINDEEGINNIPDNYKEFYHRYHKPVISGLTSYLSWGQSDKELALKVGINKEKISTIGNARLDLLTKNGRSYFKDKSNSLKQIFGDYYLFCDNFAIEKFNSSINQNLLRYSADSKIQQDLTEFRAQRKNNLVQGREKATNQLKRLITRNNSSSFIIRPHPTSNSQYWEEKFRTYRNVFVIYKDTIEPWIFGSQGLISAGCTTALLAGLAKKPVYHLETNPIMGQSFASNIGVKITDSIDIQSSSHIQIYSSYEYLTKIMRIESFASERIADELIKQSSKLKIDKELSSSEFWALLTREISLPEWVKETVKPVEPKWRAYGILPKILKEKIHNLSHSFLGQKLNLKIKMLSNCLFILSNIESD